MEDGKKIIITADASPMKNTFFIYDLEIDNFIPFSV